MSLPLFVASALIELLCNSFDVGVYEDSRMQSLCSAVVRRF